MSAAARLLGVFWSVMTYQNKPAAVAAGLEIGQFWIQQSNGAVYRLMDHDLTSTSTQDK